MSQPAQAIALLLMEHVRSPFVGPVLAYGKQAMTIGFEGTLQMLAACGIAADPAGLVDPPPPGEYIEFARFVKLLGLGELQTLDVSPYEGAEIIADLNDPVPEEFKNRFGWIVDGGTIEHVFDIRQGMKNTADMLRPGGRAVHFSPSNNYVNHGFVQISPAFYHGYYTENGFEDVRGIMLVQPRAGALSTEWNLFEYDNATMAGPNAMFCTEQTMLGLYFSARKTPASTTDRLPHQPYAARHHETQTLQFVVAHQPAAPSIQPVAESEGLPRVLARDVVHAGFGDGRAPATIVL